MSLFPPTNHVCAVLAGVKCEQITDLGKFAGGSGGYSHCAPG